MLTQISTILSQTTEPLALLTLAIIISIFLHLSSKSLAHKYSAILLSSTSIITAITIKILKNLIQAPRPTTMLIQETGYSFPSGHTTFAIVFFGLLVYIFTKPNKRIIPIITATLAITVITLSRLQLQVHHPIDILGGIIIGATILTISILIHKKLTI